MNTTWLRAVRDLLDWVLGDRSTAPLSGRTVNPPTAYKLTHEESIADDIIQQGRPDGLPTDLTTHPPPQYGEAIHATVRWLRGETTAGARRRSRQQSICTSRSNLHDYSGGATLPGLTAAAYEHRCFHGNRLKVRISCAVARRLWRARRLIIDVNCLQ
jgi:hypothetical protein